MLLLPGNLMNLKLPAAISDVTRLVKGGRLADATHAIQRALRGDDAPATAPDVPYEQPPHAAVIEGRYRRVDAEPSAPPKARGRFVTHTYTSAEGTREYKLYIPTTSHPRALPVVVMLHGCQQGPEDFAAATRMNALAEEQGLIIVYPKQPPKANNAKCWNWFDAKHQEREAGEPSLIAGITREVTASYGADPQRVYIAGLSAGGAMAAVMAATYPDLYAAVGIHSGLAYEAAHDMPSAFAAMRGDGSRRAKRKSRGDRREGAVPTIVFHGDKDDTVHPSNGDHVIADASDSSASERAPSSLERIVQEGRASGRSYTRTMYRNPEGKTLVEQWLVHGAAHAWSGGSKEGSFADPSGPDASREMVRFFLQHKI
jgi:poly(hydroxyalkanoate) depolymerase family esterase